MPTRGRRLSSTSWAAVPAPASFKPATVEGGGCGRAHSLESAREQRIRALFRCPACRAALTGQTCSGCGATYGSIGDVPALVAGGGRVDRDLRGDDRLLQGHDSAGLGIAPIRDAIDRGDLMLELGAGRERTTADNFVRSDAFVFSADHLAVVADAHALPFVDLQQPGDRMIDQSPGAHEAWRTIARAVELLGRSISGSVRKGLSRNNCLIV